MPTNLVASTLSSGFIGNASSHVIVDLVGYFAAESNDGVTSVTASAPLVSSGGATPNISLGGSIPVSNGGTGQTSLPTNGIIYGQGAGPIFATVGLPGEILAGTAGAPTWTPDPSISGNLTLVNPSTASSGTSQGNIMKGANRFIHNYGTGNTFIGENTANFTMTGGFNTGSGVQTLFFNTTGFNNTASGYRALYSNTTGFRNTASGTDALNNNLGGNDNAAFGARALFANTTGSSNAAFGYQALTGNTTGSGNTASGVNGLHNNTTGSENTSSGANALLGNTTGIQNTADGMLALTSNTTGNQNTATGYSSLSANTTGTFNVATGMNAMVNNVNGGQNVAVGVSALNLNVSGSNNAAVGNIALLNSTGNFNIALGFGAGSNLTSGSLNIDIGNAGIAAEGNTIRIGDGNQSRAFIAGIRGVTTSLSAVPVLIDSNGQLGTASSSRRFKDDIADMDAASSALMKLRPVTFHYKSDRSASGSTLQYGLIAEEVAEVYPGLVAHSADGQVETVMYQYLPSMLLNEYQKQQRTIDAQATHIAKMERDRQLQSAAISAQAAEIMNLKAGVARVAALEQQMAHMARMLDQQRAGTVTAGLELK
jgi:hypothetical protein